MKDRFVILTGAKSNAGDYLIKYRAMQLLSALRPDRDIVDYDGWITLTDEQLDVVNQSRALILTGGPALQYKMYPGVFPLIDDLTRIKVPILTLGIGWKSAAGRWPDTHDYPLSEKSIELIKTIDESPCRSSVRD